MERSYDQRTLIGENSDKVLNSQMPLNQWIVGASGCSVHCLQLVMATLRLTRDR